MNERPHHPQHNKIKKSCAVEGGQPYIRGGAVRQARSTPTHARRGINSLRHQNRPRINFPGIFDTPKQTKTGASTPILLICRYQHNRGGETAALFGLECGKTSDNAHGYISICARRQAAPQPPYVERNRLTAGLAKLGCWVDR